MSSRECKLTGYKEGIAGAMDQLIGAMTMIEGLDLREFSANNRSRKTAMRTLGNVMSAIKGACSITSDDKELGMYGPWDLDEFGFTSKFRKRILKPEFSKVPW